MRVRLVAAALSLSLASVAFAQSEESAKKWREDLAYLQRELPRRHANAFHHLSRKDFDARIQSLYAKAGSLRDYEMVVETARIIAALGPRDGHSRVNLFNPELKFHYLPLNFYAYSDGLFIRGAAKPYADIAGFRVVSIGGTPAAEALHLVETITPGDNAMSHRSFGAELMSVSEALRALRIARGGPEDTVSLELMNPSGVKRQINITPVASLSDLEWNDIRANHPAPYRQHASKDPFGRHGAEKNFWFDYDTDSQLLYVNYSAVADMQDESVAAFAKRLFEFADAHPVKKFVLDIRNNSGGNNYLNRPLFYELVKRRSTIGQPGVLFAIIGRETFSAAQNFANMLDIHTQAIFVGEPTGGSPNHFGDALRLTLPNSKVPIQLSSVWWQDQDPRDQRLWIAPDIAAEPVSRDDVEGRDAAMDAIRAYTQEPSLEAMASEAMANGGRAKVEEAIRAWRSDPRHKYLTGEAELNRAAAGLYGKSADQATALFEINAAVNPDSWLAHNSLGRAYASQNRRDAAKAEFERALQIRPDAPETLAALDRLTPGS